MKKKYTCLLMSFLAVGLMSSNANAQGAYVNIGAGFGFGDGSMEGSNFVNAEADGVTTQDTETAVFGSLGSGINFGAGFGYMFNENFGAELGVNYLIGRQFITTSEYNETATVAGSGGGGSITVTENDKSTEAMSANLLRINPSFVLVGNGDKIKPYAKFGVMLGFGKAKLTGTETGSYSNGTSTDTYEDVGTAEWSGGIGFGFSGALGAAYGLSDKMSLFAEMNINNMSWAASTSVLTSYTETETDASGTTTTDYLTGATVYQLETNYVDEITPSSNTGSNPNQSDTSPRDELKSKVGLGSVGINIGLKISF